MRAKIKPDQIDGPLGGGDVFTTPPVADFTDGTTSGWNRPFEVVAGARRWQTELEDFVGGRGKCAFTGNNASFDEFPSFAEYYGSHLGFVRLKAAASGNSTQIGYQTFFPLHATGRMLAAARIRVEANAPTSGENFYVGAGLIGGPSMMSSGGVGSGSRLCALVADASTGGRWRLKVQLEGSSWADVDTGAALAADTDYWIVVELAADCASARAYINGTQVATATGWTGTNWTNGNNPWAAPAAAILKTNGSAERSAMVDMLGYAKQWNTLR